MVSEWVTCGAVGETCSLPPASRPLKAASRLSELRSAHVQRGLVTTRAATLQQASRPKEAPVGVGIALWHLGAAAMLVDVVSFSTRLAMAGGLERLNGCCPHLRFLPRRLCDPFLPERRIICISIMAGSADGDPGDPPIAGGVAAPGPAGPPPSRSGLMRTSAGSRTSSCPGETPGQARSGSSRSDQPRSA